MNLLTPFQSSTTFKQYQPLYQIAKRLLPVLGISKNGVAYYASLVEHYTSQSLNRINSNQTCLWLLCFIYHRCQRMLDNLATMFIYTANQYEVEVTKQADELLPDWQNNKVTTLKKINKPLLNQPLAEFIENNAKPLDEKILAVNEAIASGENPYVKLKQTKEGSTVWTLPYTKKLLELNNPFYKKLPPISIIRILQFVNEKTQFMQALTHIKPHYSKSQLDEIATYACLIANGTNLGIFKMANLCDLNYTSLQTTEKNYLRLATIRMANDIVSNAIAKLPIFRHWDLCPNLLHASLDGQKFITEWDNIVARHSQKYFGFDKGVVAYSLIANHLPINTMIIGANEHESRFFFDLIYNNTSEIQPDIFSTDTEGSNQLNFLLLHLIERLYAPRYRSLGDKSDSIICFSDPTQFKDCFIKPDKKLNEKLILAEEDNIQHVLASLLMGETKQSNIVTKLSSQQFASPTKRALWEMNAVLMTDHILNYISDVTFRQSIQGSLGRGEAYHQLRRHIEKVNGRHFRGTNETQISIWNESARLLANCVLYYNATMLNQWMEQSDAKGDSEKSSFIKQLSPVAWTHINFQGRYEFLSSHEEIDIDGWLDKILINDSDFKKKN